jgi:hypothetical protein
MEQHVIDRMEGLVNTNHQNHLEIYAKKVVATLMKDGFEREDALDYVRYTAEQATYNI